MNNLRILGILCLLNAAYAAPPPPRHYFNASGPLTGESSSPASEIAERFIREAGVSLHGLSERDLDSIYLVRQYRTDHNSVTHLLFSQQYAGVDVQYSQFVVNIDSAGRILNAGGNLYPSPSSNTAPPSATSLSASIRSAMQWADPAGSPNYVPQEVAAKGKLRQFARFDGSGSIEGRASWYPLDGKLVPAWEFALNDASGTRQAATIDSVTQTVLDTRPLTLFQNSPPPPRGLVFTTTSPRPNPRPGFLMTEEPPYVPRVLVSFAGDPQASPSGWVEGTETGGNNVIAGKNPLAEFFLVAPITAKSPTRDFQFPLQLGPGAPNPTNYIEAATTNLFYWMNRSHDLFWHAGFNEAAGSYQKQNFGRGGIEGDPIYAYAQFGVQQTFGAQFNNAFYAPQSLEDGSPAMIAMFLGAGPNGVITDGSYDAEVMVHEYTHGVSSRLVRDLGGHHGGAMGEAWSDFFALEFTTPEGAPPGGLYTSGDYFLQRLNVGIRTRPYSTDVSINPITFADLGRVGALPAIHLDGGIWVQALLEMRANLIQQFGEAEGRRRARLLVIDGMKLSVPGPSMVDARDAILLADRVGFKGESQTQIWQAFATRGMGVTAYSPGNNSTHVTASFAPPSTTGVITFAERSYTFGEPARILLYDSNLQGDIVPVQVTSYEAGSDVQTVRLRRTGSYFTGTVQTSNFIAADREDGGLSVIPGSILTVFYNDANADGAPRQLTASVPMNPGYTRLSTGPSLSTAGEQPLNLRGGPGAAQIYDLPWEFPFFGRGYSSVRVLANGLLAFDVGPGSACTDVPALRQVTGIAPLYGLFRTNGTVQPNENVFVSRPTPESIIFRWVAETVVSFMGIVPAPVNFSATLYRDGRIQFNYGEGNTSLAFPAPTSSVCTATPSIGISNGGGAVSTVAEYIGRGNLENVPGIRFDPPYGAGSVPEIRIEVPNSTDKYQGIVAGQLIVWDANHPVLDVYVLIDNVFRGRATLSGPRTDVCGAESLPNCFGMAFSYNFADLGLAPGQHRLKIRAMNSRGGITERELNFNVAEGQAQSPVVRIESPEPGAEASGNIVIRGYAAAPNLRIIGIDVLIDGIAYGRAAYGQMRTDVCGSIGFTSPNCPNVGFTFNVNSTVGAIPLVDGEHLLQVRVQDETGRFTTYPETPLTFRVNNGPNQPPRGVLVTPNNGERVSGTILVWGYAWDPDGEIALVQLLVDGAIRATVPYGQSREGQCPSLPDVIACPNIGFSYEFNTKTVLNGPHVLGIRLVDNKGRSVIIPQNAANGMTIIVENE